MPIIFRSARLVAAAIALAMLVSVAGDLPAASAGTPAHHPKKHKKPKKKHKKKKASKPKPKGFNVSATGSYHYTKSYRGPAPTLMTEDLTIDWDWAGSGHAKVTPTRYGPSVEVDRLAVKLLAYDWRSHAASTGPKFDHSIYPAQWDSKSYITCESNRTMSLAGPADLSGYISGVGPEDLHPVFRNAAPADVTSDQSATVDPNCLTPPPLEGGPLISTVDLDGRGFEVRPAWAGDAGKTNCTASGSFETGFRRRCATEIHVIQPNGGASTAVYELDIRLTR